MQAPSEYAADNRAIAVVENGRVVIYVNEQEG